MFSRLFATDPQKLMRRRLQEVCPDPALWGAISAYLTRGRRPKSPQARAALRAYLDLREALGGRAAFRAAAELSHAALAGPCREFARSYQPPAGLEPAAALAWARFLLAADHLLALAHEASLSPGVSRREQAARMEALLARAVRDYLDPLARELAGDQGRTPGRPPAPGQRLVDALCDMA